MESTTASGVSQVLHRELGSDELFEVTDGRDWRFPVTVMPRDAQAQAAILDAARVLAADGYAVRMGDRMGSILVGGRNSGVEGDGAGNGRRPRRGGKRRSHRVSGRRR